VATKFTPRLVELTYEAALKSYWRKEALKKFLRASHISENFLATWGGEESKRDFLDKVFQKLQASDKGKAVIFEMARSLSEQTTFPDLRNWEDSPQKVADAKNAVADSMRISRHRTRRFRTKRREKRLKAELARSDSKFNAATPINSSSNSASTACMPPSALSKVVTIFRIGSTICWISARLRTGVPT
jgi:hypothetical protein